MPRLEHPQVPDWKQDLGTCCQLKVELEEARLKLAIATADCKDAESQTEDGWGASGGSVADMVTLSVLLEMEIKLVMQVAEAAAETSMALAMPGFALQGDNGLYYNAETGFYFDPTSSLYYHTPTSKYYFYDSGGNFVDYEQEQIVRPFPTLLLL